MEIEMQIAVRFRYEKKSNSNSNCVCIVIYGKFCKYLHSQRRKYFFLQKNKFQKTEKCFENGDEINENVCDTQESKSEIHVQMNEFIIAVIRRVCAGDSAFDAVWE